MTDLIFDGHDGADVLDHALDEIGVHCFLFTLVHCRFGDDLRFEVRAQNVRGLQTVVAVGWWSGG